ncbi:MAG: hypothetical protein AAF183_23400 [Pseudomonadota bacterium]
MDSLTRKTYSVLRSQQVTLAANDAGMLTTYPSGRTERSFASAAAMPAFARSELIDPFFVIIT